MIDLPATPAAVLAQVVVPALALLPAPMDTPQARVMLIAIGLQESGLRTRQQVGGSARGLWQNERPVQLLLLDNAASATLTRALCQSRAVAPISSDMYAALLVDDVFAAAIARLILWCDQNPLPALNDADDAFATYIRVWGPGAYTSGTDMQKIDIRQRFDDNYSAALAVVTGTQA